MKLRIFSDIHNEFFLHSKNDFYQIPVMEDEHEQVLILAGDIDTNFSVLKRFGNHPDLIRKSPNKDFYLDNADSSWIEQLSVRFKHVIYVLGNHDMWRKNIDTVYDEAKQLIKEQNLTNVTLLQNDSIVIDDVCFVGATLWTDYNKKDPLTMWEAHKVMADYHYIKQGSDYHKFDVTRGLQEFNKSIEYVFSEEHTKHDNVVVVTHHTPSFQSNVREYSRSAGYFHSEISDKIIDSKHIKLWIHGHTHDNVDYKLGHCRVVANCHGYVGYEDPPMFDSEKIVLV